MGILEPDLATIQAAIRDGASLKRTIMLGRQNILVTPQRLGRLLSDDQAIRFFADAGYAEPLLQHLGAVDIESMDITDFEGATITHDLNLPLPDEMHGRFDFVLDGGTIEHVFDAAQAIRNAKALVDVGGHALFSTPADGNMGHGFYQFSPEFHFRALEGDFEIVWCLLSETRARWRRPPSVRWFRVTDPAAIGSRNGLNTRGSVYMHTLARRVSTEGDGQGPQQSDYAVRWSGGQVSSGQAGITPIAGP